jgi:hypothetical protein
MSYEIVDGTVPVQAPVGRVLGLPAVARREMLGEVQRMSALLGLPDAVCARMLDSEAREAVQEGRKREAERQAAIERGQDAAWAHMHANAEMGLPADTPMAERLALMNPHSDDEVTRDPRAPYGSASNPAFFVNTSSGPVDIGYQAQRARESAQRSFSESVDDALIARAHEQSRDAYMVIQRSQLQSRRKHAEMARHEAALAASAPAARVSSGTGWPELSR